MVRKWTHRVQRFSDEKYGGETIKFIGTRIPPRMLRGVMAISAKYGNFVGRTKEEAFEKLKAHHNLPSVGKEEEIIKLYKSGGWHNTPISISEKLHLPISHVEHVIEDYIRSHPNWRERMRGY